jgi:hypothetical protein
VYRVYLLWCIGAGSACVAAFVTGRGSVQGDERLWVQQLDLAASALDALAPARQGP